MLLGSQVWADICAAAENQAIKDTNSDTNPVVLPVHVTPENFAAFLQWLYPNYVK